MSRALIIVLAAIAAIIGISYGAMAATSSPEFCSNCHYIKPAVEAWRASPHNIVKCLDCHADPGPIGYVKRKMYAMKELYLHVTGNYPDDFQAKVNIDNCLFCHTGKNKDKYPTAKNIAKTGTEEEVGMNHSEIIKAKSSCLDCHQGVAHGTLGDEKE